MFTGLKNQLELSDSLIENILPLDNELIKLKKIFLWFRIKSSDLVLFLPSGRVRKGYRAFCCTLSGFYELVARKKGKG